MYRPHPAGRPHRGSLSSLNAVAKRLLGHENGGEGAAVKKRRRTKWKSAETRKREFERLECMLGITAAESWREVGTAAVIGAGGRGLLQHFGNSVTSLLRHLRPEALEGGERVARRQVSRSYWDDERRAGEFLRELAAKHSIGSVEDWRRVTAAMFIEAGGGPLMKRHGGKGGLLHWAYSTPAASPAPAHVTGASTDTLLSHDNYKGDGDKEWSALGLGLSGEGGGERPGQSFGDRGQELSHGRCDGGVESEGAHESGVKEWAEAEGNGQGRRQGTEDVSGISLADRVRRRVPRGYWNDPRNRRAFLEKFMRERNMREAEDWRHVSVADIAKAGGGTLLARHKGSILRMLQTEMPERGFTVERVGRSVPRGYWDDRENRRAVLERIAHHYGIEEPQRWKGVTTDDFIAHGAGRLLHHYYGGSVAKMLTDVYGLTAADVAVVRQSMPSNHWSSAENRRRFLDDLSRSHGLDGSPESWQTLRVKDVIDAGGKGLLVRFNDSLLAALEDSYGGAFGDACRSRRSVPTGYWDDDERLQRFVKGLEKELSIVSPEEWTRVSREQIYQHNGGVSLLNAMTLSDALSRVYPNHGWQVALGRFRGGKKASQRGLAATVATIFGD